MRELVARMCRLHAECTFQILRKECPGIFSKVGLDTKEETWGRFPSIPRQEIPLDWIALGFQGHDFWENHVGIPFVIEGEIATFRTGWHINSSYYHQKLLGGPIDSFRFDGMKLELTSRPFGEQHFQLPSVPVTFEIAGSAFQVFLDQAIALYRHIHTVLKEIEPPYVPCR